MPDPKDFNFKHVTHLPSTWKNRESPMIDIEQFKSELALATDKRERLGCPKGVCCNNHLFIDSDYVRAVEDELRVYEEHVPGLLKKLLMTSGETRAIDRTYAGILSQKAKGRSKR